MRSVLCALMLFLLALWSGGCGQGENGKAIDSSAAGGAGLVIVSPHNEFIQDEFERGFNEWRVAQGKHPVQFEWQDRGGTVEIIHYITSTFAALGRERDHGIGIDLLFGGGMPAFDQLKLEKCTAAANVPAEVVEAIPTHLGGVALRDPEGHWFGAVLSSFGIITNKPGLAQKNIPEPQTWADLANPALAGYLVLADPSKSGSARLCYEVILQKYGWEKGWGILMATAGNTREFTAGASQVPREVAQGSALAGMCIDFYAYNQIESTGREIVGYVNPVNATSTGPDPIGLLRGAPHRTEAEEFIAYVLSPPGQALWGLPAGVPGGPKLQTLWRMPILPAIYEQYGDQLVVAGNPFDSANTFHLDETISARRSPLLGPLFVAAFLSNSDLLKEAWAAVRAHPENKELRAIFEAPPFSEQEGLALAERYVMNPREAIALDQQWHELFRARYQKVIELAGR